MDAHHQPGLHQEIENKNHGIDIRRNPFAMIWLNSLRLDSVGDRSAEDMGTSLDAELSLESSAFMKETTWTPLPIKCIFWDFNPKNSQYGIQCINPNFSTQISQYGIQYAFETSCCCSRWGFFQARPPLRRSWLLPFPSLICFLQQEGGGSGTWCSPCGLQS